MGSFTNHYTPLLYTILISTLFFGVRMLHIKNCMKEKFYEKRRRGVYRWFLCCTVFVYDDLWCWRGRECTYYPNTQSHMSTCYKNYYSYVGEFVRYGGFLIWWAFLLKINEFLWCGEYYKNSLSENSYTKILQRYRYIVLPRLDRIISAESWRCLCLE